MTLQGVSRRSCQDHGGSHLAWSFLSSGLHKPQADIQLLTVSTYRGISVNRPTRAPPPGSSSRRGLRRPSHPTDIPGRGAQGFDLRRASRHSGGTRIYPRFFGVTFSALPTNRTPGTKPHGRVRCLWEPAARGFPHTPCCMCHSVARNVPEAYTRGLTSLKSQPPAASTALAVCRGSLDSRDHRRADSVAIAPGVPTRGRAFLCLG